MSSTRPSSISTDSVRVPLTIAIVAIVSVAGMVAGGVMKVDASIDSAIAREREQNREVYARRTEVSELRGEIRLQTAAIEGLRRESELLREALRQASGTRKRRK